MTVVDARLGVDEVFSHALRGEPCFLVAPGVGRVQLPVHDWNRHADSGDRHLLELCEGATLDIGCGPGRLTTELAARGHITLGIDIVGESVGQTRRRGGTALRRDIFDDIPGEGRWQTALLADGNIGIGGDPVRLLNRVRRILAPGGRAVVELATADRTSTLRAHLECACGDSQSFAWGLVSIDDLPAIAARAGFQATRRASWAGRQFVVLQEAIR